MAVDCAQVREYAAQVALIIFISSLLTADELLDRVLCTHPNFREFLKAVKESGVEVS